MGNINLFSSFLNIINTIFSSSFVSPLANRWCYPTVASSVVKSYKQESKAALLAFLCSIKKVKSTGLSSKILFKTEFFSS